MRATTSAAIALTLAIFVSPLSALACAWDCGPTQEAAVTVASETCHRAEAAETPSTSSVRAVPHDCRTHDGPASTFVAATAARQPMPGTSFVSVTPPVSSLAERAIASLGTTAAHDLAPPGTPPGLIVPLRI